MFNVCKIKVRLNHNSMIVDTEITVRSFDDVAELMNSTEHSLDIELLSWDYVPNDALNAAEAIESLYAMLNAMEV